LGKLYQERGSVTLANNTAKQLDLTVPDGKRWLVHAIKMHNGDDVSRNVAARITDSSDNVLHLIGIKTGLSAGSEIELLYVINAAASYGVAGKPVLIKGGNRLTLYWAAGGTSSGGTAYYCVTYEEVVE